MRRVAQRWDDRRSPSTATGAAVDASGAFWLYCGWCGSTTYLDLRRLRSYPSGKLIRLARFRGANPKSKQSTLATQAWLLAMEKFYVERCLRTAISLQNGLKHHRFFDHELYLSNVFLAPFGAALPFIAECPSHAMSS